MLLQDHVLTGQRILVTGFTGRLGGAFAEYLADGMRANAEAPALLMQYVRSARAFLHVSTTGVYVEHDDPWYRAVETDVIGGSKLMGHYTGTKAAGEGAVRAMALVLSLPTVICRMDVQYGTWRQGLERIVEFWEPRIRAGRYPS